MEKLKVVIADDEERICQLIQALIDWKYLGMELVGVAHNGIEAYEAVREQKPDILITDIRMPGFSGLELIEKVKDICPDMEVIIISGYAHFEYAQQAIRFGVGHYLLKPINKAELTETLATRMPRPFIWPTRKCCWMWAAWARATPWKWCVRLPRPAA